MIGEPERRQLSGYARDAVAILRHSLQQISAGQVVFYRVAAVQLRLLFCDTTRRHGQIVSTALVERLWPELRLPAIMDSLSENDLCLNDWLEQKLPEGDWTVRQFIRCVCDQDGGAHVDLRRYSRLPDQFDPVAWICKMSEMGLAALEPVLGGGSGSPQKDHSPMPSQQ